MKKPTHGEELTIRYQGTLMRARCGDVTELSTRGPGAAKFNIVSKTLFRNGEEAVLVEGPRELPVKVERVTAMGHKQVNIVSLSGVFETAAYAK